MPNVENFSIIPPQQFDFREKYFTIHQLHRVMDFLAYAFEKKLYTSEVFFDVSQAFDKMWTEGLLFKLRFLPSCYYDILKSFLSDCFFSASKGGFLSQVSPIFAGVPQGSILAPLLYNIYISDIPTRPLTFLVTFADNTIILSSAASPTNVSLLSSVLFY